MPHRRIYLDYNATTPIHPEVLEEMLPYYTEYFGNPSSIHWAGRRAKEAVERARAQVALLLNCHEEEVIFTSCATESNNWAIKGVAAALRNKGNHIITTQVEHPSVLSPALYLEKFGYQVTTIPVDSEGMLDLQQLEEAITERTILISTMLANNETGTIFPIDTIGEIAARHNVLLHTDAVQGVGKIPIDWKELQVNLLSLSGHKLYAPKGVGAMIMRKGKIYSYFHGGRQERNRRAGTENVAGIVALGKACEIAQDTMESEGRRLARLRDRLEAGIVQLGQVRRNGHPELRLSHTSNVTFLDMEPGPLLFLLDQEGIAVSSGSACCSGALHAASPEEGCGPVTHVRFSLGRLTTDEDIDRVLEVLPRAVQEVRDAQKGKAAVAAGAEFAPDCE
ncbi:aminotransferase class V-fold PLP-dependent enzyme [Geomonas sp. RF6]|uniref:cysteine desulfurase family protein n=1 Tax=Geomonas sp. RF6 TaxID=2897342 RepID=UPI001E648137|nr:aminotransferase class V-fold PLP-dependent enzyme [Geomonas sp. RF6]UFS68540.1 aminotransferase class V-fold PLP-dependent enzyme [Geomonas sp. RF6]